MHPAIEFVHRFHQHLSDWFAGRRPEAEVWRALVAASPETMGLVYPSGQRLTGAQFLESIESRYGTSPGFLATIEGAQLVRDEPDHAVVAYQEVQQQATHSKSDNRRSALALIERDETGWRWRFIQETDMSTSSR